MNPTMRLNAAKCGVEIHFPAKPASSVLDSLKSHGWRWSRFNSCWYATDTPAARAFARQMTGGAPIHEDDAGLRAMTDLDSHSMRTGASAPRSTDMTARLSTRYDRWILRTSHGDYLTGFPAKTPTRKVAAAVRRDFPTWEILEPATALSLFADQEAEQPPREAGASLFQFGA